MSLSKARLALGAAAALALGVAASPASAGSCVGACGVLGANGDVTAPPNASTYGWVSTYGGVTGAGQIAGVTGDGAATDGSTFTTNAFTANAGDSLDYYFNFVTSDGQNGAGQFIYQDYAWVKLVDTSTGASTLLFDARTEPSGSIVPGFLMPPIDPGVSLNPASVNITLGTGAGGGPVWTPLGDPNDPLHPGYSGMCWGPGCGLTGWVHSAFTVSSGGSYQLVFGVTNWGDQVYDTGLAYSGLQIGGRPIDEGVPEPATWLLMIVGLGGLGCMGRRRRGERAPGSA